MGGEWFAHDHDGGDDPHSHRHSAEEKEAHEEALEGDGSCPVCGEVHELAPDEVEEAEHAEHQGEEEGEAVSEAAPTKAETEEDQGAEEAPEDEEKPTPVKVPPQPDEEGRPHARRKGVTMSAFRAHRQH